MASVTGRLGTIQEETIEPGSVVFALCGYGPRNPRLGSNKGDITFARVTTVDLDVGSDGTFTVDVPGNDIIEPPGTYYTVTVKDSNGDVVQTNAYVFLGDTAYILEDLVPFDPSLPMMPVPPLIIDELLVLTGNDTMTFDGNVGYTAFKTTLTGNVLHANFQDMVPGNLYTFIILQDGTGGWQFNWGATVHNGTMVKHDPNARTIQTFVADYDGQLYAISGGAYS
jgi:hypothetical protein